MKKTGHVLVASASGTVVLNGKTLEFGSRGSALLVDIYRRCVGDYPKFFKMDPLSRLGFVASELLLGEEKPRKQDCEDRAVVLFNRSASLADDLLYQETIQDPGNYYPRLPGPGLPAGPPASLTASAKGPVIHPSADG